MATTCHSQAALSMCRACQLHSQGESRSLLKPLWYKATQLKATLVQANGHYLAMQRDPSCPCV
jgi:hypothetical protein